MFTTATASPERSRVALGVCESMTSTQQFLAPYISSDVRRCDRAGIVFFWATRTIYALYMIFACVAMACALSMMHTNGTPANARLKGDSIQVTLNVALCTIDKGSMIVPAHLTKGDGTENMDGSFKITGERCTEPSFILNLVNVGTVLSILALVVMTIVQLVLVSKIGREDFQHYVTGVVAGMGFFGAILLFETGWAFIAVGWFVDSNYETSRSALKAVHLSATDLHVEITRGDDVWPLFTAGVFGMIASVLMIAESVMAVQAARSKA